LNSWTSCPQKTPVNFYAGAQPGPCVKKIDEVLSEMLTEILPVPDKVYGWFTLFEFFFAASLAFYLIPREVLS
jgi:hypothetical protein